MIGQGQEIGFRVRFAQTIRFRLLLTFLLISVLPLIIVASISAVSQWQTGLNHAFEELDLLASFKQAQIQEWLALLEEGLQSAALDATIDIHAPLILGPAAKTRVSLGMLNNLRDRLVQGPERMLLFDSFFLINLDGQMVFSTADVPDSESYRNARFFHGGLVKRSVYLAQGKQIVAVQPVRDAQGRPMGIFGAWANMSRLDEIMTMQVLLTQNAQNYLVNENYTAFIGIGTPERRIFVETFGSREAIKGLSGSGIYPNYAGKTVVGVYRWLPELQIALLVESPRVEALRTLWTILLVNATVGVLALVVAVVVALTTTQQIARPISNLVETARRIALGEREAEAEIERADEIGVLGQAFNSMTAQLREVVDELETRVEERTYALAQRTAYLEATAEVGHTISSILDLDHLRQQVVELIRERFGLYYVGLFQVDDGGEWAVLHAGTGDYGRRMLARRHRIRIGEGMVGWCVANNQIRMASDAGQDGVRLVTPELPNTRSEAALPLRSHKRVIGALSVQSERIDTFDQDALIALQTMTDQVAVAIYNAHLFAQVQDALQVAQRAYGDLSHRAWADLLHGGGQVAFRSDEQGVMRLEQVSSAEIEQSLLQGRTIVQTQQDLPQKRQVSRTRGGSTLTIPIRIGSEAIGVLNTFKPAEQGEWTAQQIAWLENVVEQLSYALEAARLYQQTQVREIRERQIREIGANMQARVSLDALMQTTIADLARVLNVPSAFVQLSTQTRITEE